MSFKEAIVPMLIVALIVMMAYFFLNDPALATGDANKDGRINAIDLTMMKRHIIGIYDLSQWQIFRCDMNGNGRVDEMDLETVTNVILGRN